MLVELFQCKPCVGDDQNQLSVLAPRAWEQGLDV